jgi:hypothetical protein
MNTDSMLSALTAFVIAGGGTITTVLLSQPGGTASINLNVWIGAAVVGLIAGAKDYRSLNKLPPVETLKKMGVTLTKTVVVLMAAFLLVGCSTVKPYLTPVALTAEVSQGIKSGLGFYPSAAPDVQLAQGVICTLAQSTNTNPALIVSDLQGIGITNGYSALIVNAAVLSYETVYDLIGTNSTDVVEPYLTALCNGFTAGLAPSTQVKHPLLTPHLK